MKRPRKVFFLGLTALGVAILLLLFWPLGPPVIVYVSSDGGFVEKEDFKTPLALVEDCFQRYCFLRDNPNLVLYRTTRLNLFSALSPRRWRYSYNDHISPKPVNWIAELRQKAIRDYLPKLPSPMTVEDIRFFFYNDTRQSDPLDVSIYGIYNSSVFGLTVRINPRHSANGRQWENPVWCYGGVVGDPQWHHIWDLVNEHKAEIIRYWDSHYQDIVRQFDARYAGLF